VSITLKSAAGRGLLAATILGSGMAFLDGTIIMVALPRIGAELDASVAGLQWTVNAYTLPLAALVLLGGALGDRFGRRRIFLVGIAWFTVASVLCAVAPTIELLVAARALQGIGSALLTPGSLALISASLDEDDRARAIGLWAGLGGLFGVVGPLAGGLIIDELSWRWAFYINIPLAALVLGLTLRYVPESRDETDSGGRFDVAGAALCALGLAGITFALVETSSPLAIPAAVAGVLALVGFVAVERMVNHPMMPLSLFRSRPFSVINAATLLAYAALGGMGLFLTLQLQIVGGWSALQAGAAGIPMTLLLLVGSGRAGEIGKRIGPRLPLGGGMLIAAAGLALLLMVGPEPSYWRDVLPGVVLFGIGLTLFVAPLTASVLAAAPDRYSGVASGINNAVARTGSLLIVAALPAMVGLAGADYADPEVFDAAYRGAMVWCAGLLVAAALLSLTLLPRRVEVRNETAVTVE